VDLLDTLDAYLRDGFRPARTEPSSEIATSPVAAADDPRSSSRTVRSESVDDTAGALAELAAAVSRCERCGLSRSRKLAVAGEGVPSPLVLAVGEAPGAEEDRTGRPFVGAAGRYLDKWLAAVGLDRGTNCYIANVVKCRPPGNRDPAAEEIEQCRGYLERQIDLLRPRAILAVGRFAAQVLTGTTLGITALRGATHAYRGTPLVATYHPAAVLRDPGLRAAVWEDLKRLRALYGDG
jgi:DNA polymerase